MIFEITGNKADIISLLVEDAIGFLLRYVRTILTSKSTASTLKIITNVYIVGMTGLNRRPLDPQSSALPNYATSRVGLFSHVVTPLYQFYTDSIRADKNYSRHGCNYTTSHKKCQSLICCEISKINPDGETMTVNFDEPVSTVLLALS